MKSLFVPSLIALLASTSPSLVAGAPRIVGGSEVTAGDYPWVAGLLNRYEPNVTNALDCGGTLIHPSWVLTAAHCVQGRLASDVQVLVGATDLTATGLQRVNVTEIIRHPAYNPISFDSDVALLRLETPVTGVKPVELIDDPAMASEGVLATVLGWGLTAEDGTNLSRILREVSLPIMDSETANAPDYLNGEITGNMLAAGLAEGGKDTCGGDSGGPMVIRGRNGQWVQAGIASWGVGCARPKRPGVYTRVSKFRQWIQSYIWPNYVSWEQAAGITTDDGPDVDGDGHTQWEEYAFRTDPRVPALANGFPAVSMADGVPAITIQRPAGGGDLTWSVLTSVDLASWTARDPAAQLLGSPAAVSGDSGAEQITWKGVAAPGRSFVAAAAVPSQTVTALHHQLEFPGGVTHSLNATDTLSAGFRQRDYQLTGLPTGQAVTLTLRSDAFNSVLRLLNATTGSVISSSTGNTGSGNDERLTFTPASGTTYAARVTTSAAGATGEFTLAAYRIPTGTPSISRDATVNGRLAITDPVDSFYPGTALFKDDIVFTLTAATPITVRMASTAFDSRFAIINAETGELLHLGYGVGVPSAAAPDQLIAPAQQSFVPRPGVAYYLRASSAAEESVGNYTLSTITATTIAPGGSADGALAVTDGVDSFYAPGQTIFIDDYVLVAPVGTPVTFTVVSSQIDSTLELLDAGSGESLALDDDPNEALGDSFITFTPRAGHRYVFRVSSYSAEEVGTYTVYAD